MVWAYVWAAVFAGKPREKIFVPAVLMLGVLADVDLFLRRIGVQHHTLVHSPIFWLLIFTPFFIMYRQRALPYFAAVVQHFLFGDFLVGSVMVLWPFSSLLLGLNVSMSSLLDVIIETVGLALAAIVSYHSGDLRFILSVDIHNMLMMLPLMALLSSMMWFSVDWAIIPLLGNIWSRKLVTAIVFEHIALAIVLSLSTFQGLRALAKIQLARYT
ncbi:MAG: hypothetical protein QG670_975 [Thermoproteota archaeon]|nr:hypothetical protein [Thermoproteota archaeon]